jgi:hypothetical protein
VQLLLPFVLFLLLPVAAAASDSIGAFPSYSFEESVQHGVIDFVVNPWAHPDIRADLDDIVRLDPGLVNRLGFEYGGMSPKGLGFSGAAAQEIHRRLPRARIGGGFPQNLQANYLAVLPCDSETDLRTFRRDGMTGGPYDRSNLFYWVKLDAKPAQDYYICIGKAQIRRHFNHLHFEESDHVLANCTSRLACVLAYKRIAEELIRYANDRGICLSFSGEPELAREMALDSVYVPARFYIDDFDREYRNKIVTGEGDRYSYVLSPLIVRDVIRKVPGHTRVFFYVDNFDFRQDDLRRMMELDGPNRRGLIKRSADAAANGGATFIPSYNHCDGCVPLNLIGDSCERSPNTGLSFYNAHRCGDLGAIRASLEIQREERGRNAQNSSPPKRQSGSGQAADPHCSRQPRPA